MQLRHQDVVELTASLPLALELEPYRRRLEPLAIAVLGGEPRRVIDRRRDLVVPEVWDEPLKRAALQGMALLAAELERKLAVLSLARADVERSARSSKLAASIVDRVLADLLDANDANIDALERLERELEALAPDERAPRAPLAARGANAFVRIPPTEIRAAFVRGARAGLGGNAEGAAISIAQSLGSRSRREAAREWVRRLADASAEHVPLLAGELMRLADAPLPDDPGDDVVWVEACIGLTLELGLAQS